jgi:hypothetical protein
VVPAQAPAALGGELIAVGVVGWATAAVIDYRAGRSEYEPAWSRPFTRLVPMAVCGICVIVAGVSEAAQAGGGLYWLVPATLIAILAGLVNTWVLLVEIMR